MCDNLFPGSEFYYLLLLYKLGANLSGLGSQHTSHSALLDVEPLVIAA